MSRLSVFFALLIGCCSCGREASDAVVYEVSARKMEGLDDIFDFYGPFFFDEADSCLVKSEGQGENVVVRFDCRKGVLKNRIRRGRGPGEYLDLRVVGVNPATGDFQAVSSVGRSVVSFSREMVPLDTVTFGTALFDAVRAGDFFVSYGDYAATDNHMFSLFDTLGQAVGRFGKFPDDGMSDAFRDKVMAYQGKLLANRTCSRFAFFRVWGMSLIYTELGRIGIRSVSFRSARSYPFTNRSRMLRRVCVSGIRRFTMQMPLHRIVVFMRCTPDGNWIWERWIQTAGPGRPG